MGHGKETPRQKMIGMMYLVLTAMLALNVSREVLEGFSVVNRGMVETNANFDRRRGYAYSDFEKEFKLNEIEVGPFWDKAKVAMKLSADMVKYIENLRDELVATTEQIPIDSARNRSLDKIKAKDNYTEPTRYLIGEEENLANSKARALKNKLDAYRKAMIGLVSPKNQPQLKIGLETNGEYHNMSGKKVSWEMHHFYDIPLAADLPILNKFIAEVHNAELEVVNTLLRESIAEDFKYDRIEAKVLPKSNYIFTGDDFEAEVIVAAYDTSHSPSPSVYLMRGADSLPLASRDQATLIARDHGRLNIKFPTTALGLQKYAGFVSVPTASGRERTYHFNGEYFVAQPSTTISPTKMNVLYVGVENPLSISVSGVPKEDLKPTLSRGTLKEDKASGGWVAIVPGDVKEVAVEVSMKTATGMKRMGVENFRVKPVPDPTPAIGGKKFGFIQRAMLINAGKIVATMPKDFDFNFHFEVISFKLTMERGFENYEFKSKSANLTDEMARELYRTNRGQQIVFEEIVVRGSDGSTRTLSPLFLTIS